MKRILQLGGYLLFFLLMALIVPHLFKNLPFVILPLLLIASVLIIRRDLQEPAA